MRDTSIQIDGSNDEYLISDHVANHLVDLNWFPSGLACLILDPSHHDVNILWKHIKHTDCVPVGDKQLKSQIEDILLTDLSYRVKQLQLKLLCDSVEAK